MSGTLLTSSRRKSKRLSDMMHCFMCDGDRVLALREFVMRRVLVSSDSTKSSRVRGVFELRCNLQQIYWRFDDNVNKINIIVKK